MDIGIVFGGFCPLHQGHMDLIMRAKKENDRCYVFVCGYDNEPRANQYDLELSKRYRIISNFLSDEIITVDYISDTELGIDESYSDENWKIWIKAVYNKIKEYVAFHKFPLTNFNWYVAEPSYQEKINSIGKEFTDRTNCILIDRTKNPISGTKIRENPIKYWNKITVPFRPYFSHNILIAGTASEGKTTLVTDIGKYFGLPYSYEKGRDICLLKSDPEFSIKDFMYNIYEQHKYNEELICSPWNPGVFVSDTDNMVTLMYAKAYSERPNFALNKDDYETLYRMAEAYAKTDKWDKIFLLPPKPQAIVDDGYRYMEDSDYYTRLSFYKHLKSLYDDFGYEYEEIRGNYYENFLKVKNYIESLYNKE